MEAVTRVVDSTGYILGREVNDLEERIAAYCGAACGIGVSSGTDALLVSLMSLDIGPGDLVLTTPYTFFATMGTVLRVGARPVFVDVEADSLNMDPDRMAEALAADRKNGARIKAVIPVHLYGQCADMDRIGRLAGEYGVPVIEDAAQAIGAEYPSMDGGTVTWKRAGSMGLSGCFSFFRARTWAVSAMAAWSPPRIRPLPTSSAPTRNHRRAQKYYHSRGSAATSGSSPSRPRCSVKLVASNRGTRPGGATRTGIASSLARPAWSAIR